jgi:hypothetical protein
VIAGFEKGPGDLLVGVLGVGHDVKAFDPDAADQCDDAIQEGCLPGKREDDPFVDAAGQRVGEEEETEAMDRA